MAIFTLDDDDLGVIVVEHRVIGFVNEEGGIGQQLISLVDDEDNILMVLGAFVGVDKLGAQARGLALEGP